MILHQILSCCFCNIEGSLASTLPSLTHSSLTQNARIDKVHQAEILQQIILNRSA